jgi:hypothetical protein
MIPVSDSVPSRSWPVITWMLIAVNVWIFRYEVTLGPELEAFLLMFPHARVLTLVPLVFVFFHVVELPAVLYIGFWFLMQLLSGTLRASWLAWPSRLCWAGGRGVPRAGGSSARHGEPARTEQRRTRRWGSLKSCGSSS